MTALNSKLCFFAVLFCLISIGISDSKVKYPFFPHSKKDERRIRNMVDEINAANLPWKAEYNARASLKSGKKGWAVPIEETLASLKLDGLDLEASIGQQIVGDTETHLTSLARANISVPESFDAREKWPRCDSINEIQNQGGCGSCWLRWHLVRSRAVSLLEEPWTRGSFGSKEGCKPYEVAGTCGTPCPKYFYTPKYFQQCKKMCNENYGESYEHDLKRGKSFYWIKIDERYRFYGDFYGKVVSEMDRVSAAFSLSSTDFIKREIMTNGPVAVCTGVSEPFAHYRSGIFTSAFDARGDENLSYGHCMRLIGWGKERGAEFWTVANSWGTEWGENGFGRISTSYHADTLSVVSGLW